MQIVAYIRVSTDKQDLDTQKLALLEFARKEQLTIDEFIETVVSTRKQKQGLELDELIKRLSTGDTLIISELTRAGRSLGGIIKHVELLIQKKINFISVKENLRIMDGKQDLQAKITVAMFGLFAEVERELISQRTKEGIAKARASGKRIGRPKGKGKSKLDGREAEIVAYLDKKITKASIAKLIEVAPNTLNSFIKSRQLEAGS